MKRSVLLILSVFILLARYAGASTVRYAEQYYRLYHQSLYRYVEDSQENISILEGALNAPFANPLYALATIEDETEWEKYRNLFVMHVYLKITDEYLAIAAKYDKFRAYFYNYPWKYVNLDSLNTAERFYRKALENWNLAQSYGEVAGEPRFRYVHLEEIQYWEDEAFRIETGELNYTDIIQAHLDRLSGVRSDFEAMDYETY